MQTLIINLTATHKCHRAIMNDRDFLVALSTLIVPGVLDGSNGPLFYPTEEVANSADKWNGCIITLGHPKAAGQVISATRKDLMQQSPIGVVKNARFETGKLLADLWFDVGAIQYLDQNLYLNLLNNQPQELSTGLFATYEKAAEGSNHKGRTFTHIARDLKPDHLAILTDSVGACSRSHGCGVLANEQSRGPGMVAPVLNFSDRIIDKTETKETKNKETQQITEGRGPGLVMPVIDWSKK